MDLLSSVCIIKPIGNGDMVASRIAFLNNKKMWSRERIAQWLVDSGNDCESVDDQTFKSSKGAFVVAERSLQAAG